MGVMLGSLDRAVRENMRNEAQIKPQQPVTKAALESIAYIKALGRNGITNISWVKLFT